MQLGGTAATSAGAATLAPRQKRSSLRAEHYAGVLLISLDTFLGIATTLKKLINRNFCNDIKLDIRVLH